MNTILMRPETQPPSKGRILAIEPDHVRAQMLQHLIQDRVCAELDIVGSGEHAVRSIAERVPDLVLTSTFLPPRDEAVLSEYLKGLPAPAHLQVITVPYFIDSEDAASRGTSRVLSFLKRRSAQPACAPVTVTDQIAAYLQHARATRLASHDRSSCPAPPAPRATTLQDAPRREMELVRPRLSGHVNPLATPIGPGTYLLGRRHANDRRRACRHAAGELPWLWAVKLPSGMDVRVVDISSQGALLETSSKIAPGSTAELRLIGQDTNIGVQARMMRTEVGAVNAMGVRYRVAAAFVSSVEIRGLEAPPGAASSRATALADLLARVLADVDRGSGPAALRSSFEQGLRRLLPVQDVQIRQAPVIPRKGSESIYFTVPGASSTQPILQAIFEPNYQPSAKEFRLLKAAAGLAAVVLEFAPLCDAPARLIRA